MPTDLDTAKFIALSTFKRDGTAVSTPVWVVPFNGGYAFTTGASSFKVRRLNNNPAVTVSASNYKGVVAKGSAVHHGTATIDASLTSAVDALIKSKYKVTYPLLISTGELWRKLRGKPEVASVAVLISLTD
jgi:PPOX class probable F420-dependent enzyme